MVELGNNPTQDRFPFYLSLISLIIPYYIVYKLKLIDIIKNILISVGIILSEYFNFSLNRKASSMIILFLLLIIIILVFIIFTDMIQDQVSSSKSSRVLF